MANNLTYVLYAGHMVIALPPTPPQLCTRQAHHQDTILMQSLHGFALQTDVTPSKTEFLALQLYCKASTSTKILFLKTRLMCFHSPFLMESQLLSFPRFAEMFHSLSFVNLHDGHSIADQSRHLSEAVLPAKPERLCGAYSYLCLCRNSTSASP